MENFRVRSPTSKMVPPTPKIAPPTSKIVPPPSRLVLFQCGVVMVLTGTLSHLCKVNDIARYIIFGFGAEKPMTGRKFVHLEEGDNQRITLEVSEKKDRYQAPQTPDIDSGTPPKTEDNFRCT